MLSLPYKYINMEIKQLPIEGLKYYTINEYGEVFNIKTQRVRKPSKDGNGYLQVNFMQNTIKKNYKVHRLVALAFIPNNTGYNVINHKDGIKTNNHYTNLEWCSHSQNRLHASRVLGYNTNKHLFKNGNSSHSKKCEVIKGPKPGIYNSWKEAGIANGVNGSQLSAILRKGFKSERFEVRLID